MKLVLIGASIDIGASAAGCRPGPGALRVAGIGKTLWAFGVDIHDAGDVVGLPNPQSPLVDGYRHLPEVIERSRMVRDAVAAELVDGRMPALMGGDYSLAIDSISAIVVHCRRVDKKLRVIWMDAHADININEFTPSGNIYGMLVACLLGDGPEELTGMSDRRPAIEVDNTRQVGLRSVDPGEKRVLVDKGLEVFDMCFPNEADMRYAMGRVLHDIGGDIYIHLSLNLDFVDSQVAPDVGTLTVGGLTCREVQLAMEMIADTGRLGSIGLVKVNPVLNIYNITAELAVDFAESLFGRSTLPRFTEARRSTAPGRGRT